jgi:hypothetical protein
MRHTPNFVALHLSERRIDFSSVIIVASIFRVIVERQKSFLFVGFSRVSDCLFTGPGLSKYPDAVATRAWPPCSPIWIKPYDPVPSNNKVSRMKFRRFEKRKHSLSTFGRSGSIMSNTKAGASLNIGHVLQLRFA